VNNRERLLAILNHQAPDRTPWIPRLLLWYNARCLTHSMPKKWEGLSLREVERELNLGTPARDGKVFDIEQEGLEIVTREEGGCRITEYHTPVGMVRQVMGFSETLTRQGLPGRVQEYPLKEPKDYAVWEWIVEHTNWVPAYDAYKAYDAEIGEDGLPMISVGDVPLHDFLERLAGYEYGFYHLADYSREVEHLLALMAEVQRERMWPVVANCPARLLLHGLHLSSQFTPPRLFEKYILPYYEQFMPLLHDKGISVAMHADNDTSRILDLIDRAGWDMVECFVSAPMAPVTLEQARAVWGNRIIIWGGVPSTLLSPNVPEDEFRTYMHQLLDTISREDAFILGVSDNVMPDSLIDRIAWISDIVAKEAK